MLHAYPSFNDRRGATLIYVTVAMTVLMAIGSLAVDLGRVQVVKTELQRAADAASRYAASSLAQGISVARTAAVTAAGENLADGTSVALDSTNDIDFGSWDSTTRTFTVLTGPAQTSSNAVRVSARRVSSRGTAVPLMFARVLGRTSCDAQAVSVATTVRSPDSVMDVPATSNPWLAGMPAGTIANPGNPSNNPDHAPDQSPPKVNGVNLTAGKELTFDSIDGGANNFSSSTTYNPDGNTGLVTYNNYGAAGLPSENGIANIRAPINAVIGLFLDDNQPNLAGAPPSALLFDTAASRDFASLSPLLRQPFYIGDGRKADGTIQKFVVPTGATRLYIGTMDGYEWSNNVGKFTVSIYRDNSVRVVK